MEHCITTSFDSRLCIWCFLEHRRPLTQCRCFLKCFHVQCYEVLLQVLDLQLQCGNLPYQLVSWLPKKTSVSSDGIYYTIHVLVKTSVTLRIALSLNRVTEQSQDPTLSPVHRAPFAVGQGASPAAQSTSDHRHPIRPKCWVHPEMKML